jgi:hypothetical protein
MTDTTQDPVIDGLAKELKEALLARGLDPKNPPVHSAPPANRAFAEYQLRGGIMTDEHKVMEAIIKRTGEV